MLLLVDQELKSIVFVMLLWSCWMCVCVYFFVKLIYQNIFLVFLYSFYIQKPQDLCGRLVEISRKN